MLLLFISVSLLVGVALNRFVADITISTEFLIAGLAIAAAVGLLGMISRKAGSKTFFTSVVVLFVVLGFARGATVETNPSESWINVPPSSSVVTLEGVLRENVSRTDDNDFNMRLEVDKIVARGDETVNEEAEFDLFLYAGGLAPSSGRKLDDFRYGDRYRFSGRFTASDGSGDIAGFISANRVELVSSNEGFFLRRNLAALREAISSQYFRFVPDATAGLGGAITVGNRARVDPTITENFRGSGLSHILAISGLHLSLIGGLALALCLLIFGRWRLLYIIIPLIVIWFYASLAGFTPSVTRAVIMFSTLLIARLLGRQNNVLPSLSLAAAIMVLIDPNIIVSISFQLSFLAVLGISFITTQVDLNVKNWRFISRYQDTLFVGLLNWAVLGLAVSIGATAFTFPLVLSTFDEATFLGPIMTLFVAPLLPIFFLSLIVALPLSLIWEPLGSAIGFPATVIGEYMVAASSFGASLEWARVQYENLPLAFTLGWYIVLALLIFRKRIGRICANFFRKKWYKSAATLGVAAVVLVAGWGVSVNTQTQSYLTAHFPATTVGDMILVETPQGFQILIDGARGQFEAVEALNEILPDGDRTIDLVILTHHDADHIGGLEAVLDRYEVRYILDSNATHTSGLARNWDTRLDVIEDGQSDTMVVKPVDGMVFSLSDGTEIEVIWAGVPDGELGVNDQSTVVKLTYGNFSALFTGDISASIENLLVLTEPDLLADVLKVAHHGSSTSSSVEFLRAVSPSIAVVQAGDRNPFGHPDEEVVDRLREVLNETDNTQLLVTKDVGDVIIRTDGDNVWVDLD